MISKSTGISAPFLVLATCSISTLVAADIAISATRIAVTPNGSADTSRLAVGTGEIVDFTSNVGILEWKWARYPELNNWTYATGATLSWRAPMIVGIPGVVQFLVSGKKTAGSSGTQSRDFIFNVYPPSTNFYAKTGDGDTFPAGNAGALYNARIQAWPTFVSFSNCQFREGVCPATNASGFLFDTGYATQHTPNYTWSPADSNNVWGIDQIGTFQPGVLPYIDRRKIFPPSPKFWPGYFDWDIPQNYRVIGNSGEQEYCKVLQTFSIEGNGTMTVTKLTSSETHAVYYPPPKPR